MLSNVQSETTSNSCNYRDSTVLRLKIDYMRLTFSNVLSIYIHTYIYPHTPTNPCAHSLSTRGLWTTIDWTWTIQTSSIARVSINTQQLLLGDLVLIGAFAMILNIYSRVCFPTKSNLCAQIRVWSTYDITSS